DGLWNERGASVRITIIPPFWRTLWFRILIGVSLAGIVFLAYHKRVKHIEIINKKLEIQVAERTAELAEKNRQLELAFQELKDAQTQLAQAEKMASLGNLAAGIVHEINSPVAAIKSGADTSHRLIKKVNRELKEIGEPKGIKENKETWKVLDVLESNNNIAMMACERIMKIIQSLKNFARLEQADFKEADIHEGLESTLTLLHHETKNRIKIVKKFGNIPRIFCYPNLLNQVFMNILANATQAIEDKGTITIKTSKNNDDISISISDNGKGIKKKDLKHIFDPGFTTKGVGVGTGLGLSISHNIITNHKGQIKVRSEIDKGAEFVVTLPIKQERLSTKQ
ncbi:sensor histidine kinase, partial [Acidobacteriota bacterium]